MCADPIPPSWKEEIVKFLSSGAVPGNQKEAKALRGKASRFVIMDGELYKRGFSLSLLKCLTPEEENYVLRETHEGICGNHLGGKALAGKALRQGFFWPTMLFDAHRLWGMHLVGPFPQAAGQRKFLIIAVDYFTKWVEAEPLAKISEKEVIKFLWKNIICRFGIPRAIISDNGTQFSGNKLKDWCKGLAIKQVFTLVSNAQANGQTEVTNRTILQHLKTRLENAKGPWVDELPSVLWDCNEQRLRMNLDFVEEVREKAAIQAAVYRTKMAKVYNARVKPRNFQVGDLVMRKAEALGPIGKLDPK
ncbi:UNVERIFIED_CONTAM: hypothetical protein Sindi_0915900 [Sesamum indicum]